MSQLLVRSLLTTLSLWATTRDRLSGEAGEGVISAAIAVLVMAFLGAAMWVAFDSMFQGATADIQTQVDRIGG